MDDILNYPDMIKIMLLHAFETHCTIPNCAYRLTFCFDSPGLATRILLIQTNHIITYVSKLQGDDGLDLDIRVTAIVGASGLDGAGVEG